MVPYIAAWTHVRRVLSGSLTFNLRHVVDYHLINAVFVICRKPMYMDHATNNILSVLTRMGTINFLFSNIGLNIRSSEPAIVRVYLHGVHDYNKGIQRHPGRLYRVHCTNMCPSCTVLPNHTRPPSRGNTHVLAAWLHWNRWMSALPRIGLVEVPKIPTLFGRSHNRYRCFNSAYWASPVYWTSDASGKIHESSDLAGSGGIYVVV